MAAFLASILPLAQDSAEEGRNVITGMLVVGLIFVGVIALGEFGHWVRRRDRRHQHPGY